MLRASGGIASGLGGCAAFDAAFDAASAVGSAGRLRNVGTLSYGGAVDPSDVPDAPAGFPVDVPTPVGVPTLADVPDPADFGPAGDPPSALSPSRAADFMTCPLLYRFRVIDRIPEPPTTATARGTLVHAVLERLFDRPAGERTPAAALDMLVPEWERLAEADAGLAELFSDDSERARFVAEAAAALDGYFTLEDPRRLEPAQREWYVEAELDSGLRLRGYIDRLDMTKAGDIRIVDYKTGRVPREAYEASALFQMKFYALVIWRLQGVIPRMLQLMYLSDGEVLRYSPDEADLRATQRKVEALWQAIERARVSGDWRPRPSRLCDWCRHKALCPEFGGTLPPLPASAAAAAAVSGG
jgi:putative RecB family exonuclease